MLELFRSYYLHQLQHLFPLLEPNSKVIAVDLSILYWTLCLFPIQSEAFVLSFHSFCKVWVDLVSIFQLPICFTAFYHPKTNWEYWVSWTERTTPYDLSFKGRDGELIKCSVFSQTCVIILSFLGRRRFLLFSPMYQLVTTTCGE